MNVSNFLHIYVGTNNLAVKILQLSTLTTALVIPVIRRARLAWVQLRTIA